MILKDIKVLVNNQNSFKDFIKAIKSHVISNILTLI